MYSKLLGKVKVTFVFSDVLGPALYNVILYATSVSIIGFVLLILADIIKSTTGLTVTLTSA